MNNDKILYRRNMIVVRYLGFILAIISLIVTIIDIIYSLFNHKAIDFSTYTFPIFAIPIGLCLYFFIGYTKDIIVLYNNKGFSKNNSNFVEWSSLKYWKLETKINQKSPTEKLMYPDMPYWYWSIVLGTSHVHTLILKLNDDKEIIFDDNEVNDIMPFIKYLYKNHKDKLSGKVKL